MKTRLPIRTTLAALLLTGATIFATISPAQADALEDIKQAGVINVGVFADFPPFSSASADMSLKGYDVDVAQYIADSLGVEMNLVGVTGQNRIPYLNDHRVDLLMSVGYSAERAEVIDFAVAYAPYYIAVIGPAALEVAGPDDLAEKTIAVNRGTLEDTSLTEAAPETAEIMRFDNYNAVIQAFISGQTELMVVGNDVGAQVLARQEALKPEQKFQLLTSPSHIGLNKGEEPLKTAINDAVAAMLADGKLNESSEAWLKVPLNPENLKDWPLFGWLNDALGAILSGSAMTLLLIAVTTLLGTVISVLFAAGRRSGSRLLRSVITGYVELIRNTPFLVQLFFIYFGLPSLGIRLDPFAAAILAMTLNMAAYTTEIVGAGLDAVPKGQKEAASALGLHPVQVFMKIVLPQALKVIYPALTSQIIIMMLESAVVSQIAVRELTFEADMIQARTFRAFETYLVVTLVYLGLSIGVRRLLIWFGQRTLSVGAT